MADRLRLDFEQALQSNAGHLYRSLRSIGRGGTAEAYLVFATSGPHSGLLFAAKIFRRFSKPAWIASFLREHEFLRECDHPAVMRAYDQGAYLEESPFVIAEYLPETLSYFRRKRKALRINEQLSLATQLPSALSYLDQPERAVVHRDIKPTNIFFKGGSWVLGDFGLMKRTTSSSVADRDMLKESMGPGMPRDYRTPDLLAYLRGGPQPTAKSDVFQLGLVLTEVFTGFNPQKPSGHFESDVRLDPTRDIPGELATPIRELLTRMLIFDPANRPRSAEILPQWQDLFLSEARRSRTRHGKKPPAR